MSKEERLREQDRQARELIQIAAMSDALLHEDGDVGPPLTVSVATNIASRSYFNICYPTSETFIRAAAGLSWQLDSKRTQGIAVDEKSEMWVYTAGPLTGGDWQSEVSEGTARQKGNVQALYAVGIDLDKGHATQAEAFERLVELDWLGGACITYNHLNTQHKLPWKTRKLNRKTGNLETLPGAFASYCKGDEPSDELARQYVIEQEGYSAVAVGSVQLGPLTTGNSSKPGTDYYQVLHGPIPKIRVPIAIEPFLKMPHETTAAFEARWQRFYHGIAQQFGFPYDRSCDTLERCFYGLTFNRRQLEPTPPLIHRGRLVSARDVPAPLLPTANVTVPTAKSATPSVRRRPLDAQEHSRCASLRKLWLGFRAADAAADLWDDVTDKRSEKGLVAIECPFIDEHVTSNRPGTRQCALFNAASKSDHCHARCFADSCKHRAPEEFLEALFTPEQRHRFR